MLPIIFLQRRHTQQVSRSVKSANTLTWCRLIDYPHNNRGLPPFRLPRHGFCPEPIHMYTCMISSEAPKYLFVYLFSIWIRLTVLRTVNLSNLNQPKRLSFWLMAYQTKKKKSRAESASRIRFAFNGYWRGARQRERGSQAKLLWGFSAALQLQMFDKIYCIVNFE